MGYDSKDEKEKAEERARRLDALLRKARDQETMNGLLKLLQDSMTEHGVIHQKVVLGISTAEDMARLDDLTDKMEKTLAEIRLMQSALWHALYGAALKAFSHYKELAEAGNPEAKEIYERLKPLYQAGLLQDHSKRRGVN